MEMPDFESVMEQMRSVSRKPSAFRKANTKPGAGYAKLFANTPTKEQTFRPNNASNPDKQTHIRGVSDTRSGKELQRGSGVDRKGYVSRGTRRADPDRDKSPKGGNPFVGADGTVGQTRFRDFLQYNPLAKYYQPVSQNLGLRLENLAGNGVGTRRLWYLDWKGNPTADIGKARLMDKATGKVLTEPPMPMPVEEMLRRYQPVLSPMPALRMMGEDKDALGEAERARALELEKELALNSEVERVSRQSGLPEDAVREIIRDAVYSEVDSQELQRKLRHESASKESREQYEQYEKRANEILQQQIDTYNDYLQNPDKYNEEVEPPEFYYVPGTSTRPGYYSYRGAIRNIVNDLMKADNPNYIGNITPQALFDSLPAEYQFELASLTEGDLAMLLSKGITAKDLLKIPAEQVADRVDRMLDVPRTLGGTDVNDEYFDSIAADEAAFRDNEEKRWRELDILNRPTYAEMKARKEKEEEESLFSQLFGKEQERGSITMSPKLGSIQADLKNLDGKLERAQRDYELAVQNLGEEKASRSKSAKRLEKMQVKRNALLKDYVRLGGTIGEDGRIPKEEIERAGKERGLIDRLRGRSQFRDFERQLLEAIDESKTMPTQYLQDMGFNVGGHVPNPEVDRIYNNMRNHGSLTRNFKKRLGRVMNTLDFQRARDARTERRRNYKVPQTYQGAQPFERERDPEFEAHLAKVVDKLKAEGKLKPPVYDKPRGELTNMSEKKRMMEALYVQTMNKSGYSDSLQDAIDDVLFENSGKSWEGLRDTLFREFPMLRSPEDADKLEQIAIAFSHFDKASTDYNTWYKDQGINGPENPDGIETPYVPATQEHTDYAKKEARKLVENGQLKRPDVDMSKDEKKEAERAAIASELGRQDRKTPVQGVGNSDTTSKKDLDYVPSSVEQAVDDAKENKKRGSPRPTAEQAMGHVDQVDRNKAKKQKEDERKNLAKQKAQQDAEASAQEALKQKTQTDAEAAEVTRNQQATKRAELKAGAGTLENHADNQIALVLQDGRIEEPETETETERKQASVFDMTEMMSIRDMMESIRKNDSKEGHPYGKPIQGNVFAYGSTQSTIGCERDIPMPDTIPTRKTNEEGATSRKLEL